MSEFCSCRNPIFSSAMSSLQNAHLHWNKSVPFWKNNLNSSSELFLLLFIPPCPMQAPLSFFFSLQGPSLCTVVHFLHCTELFPSTCSVGVSASLCFLPAVQPKTHSGAFHAHSYFIVQSCDVLLREGQRVTACARTMRSDLF